MIKGKKDWAEKKVEIAIDKMVDLCDDYEGEDNEGIRYDAARILELLNPLANRIRR